MARYLLRRLIFAVSTLLLLSMVIFGMVKYAPSDQAITWEGRQGQTLPYHQQIAEATRLANAAHLHLPVFYFALTTADRPDTVDRIFPYERRERLVRLLDQSGYWPAVQQYETALGNAEKAAWEEPASVPWRLMLTDLRRSRRLGAIDTLARAVRDSAGPTALEGRLETLAQAAETLHTELRLKNRWLPALHWFGGNNQYHRWLTGFLVGDFGRSVSFQRPVWEVIRFPLLATLFVNGLSVLLAFGISIPLGITMARRQGRFDRLHRWALLLLNAMPGFWLGGLLVLLLATPHTGLHWIDGIDLAAYDPADGPFLLWVGQNAGKFILPVLTITLHALALITLQLRGSLREVLFQDFIRTARAKGLAEKVVYRRHAFRNALFPLITIIAGVFPALFAGSIVIEYLFAFPGMGMKTFEAYAFEDYPVLFAILMLGAVLTVAGNFLGDVLYVWADPRVRLDRP